MSDHDPVDGVDYEIVIGDSFTKERSELHLMKYEFKPLSVDDSSPGRALLETNKVSVYLPDKNGKNAVEFKGSRKDLVNDETECILLWNPSKRVFTLEKLSSTAMTLRPTRKKAKLHHPPELRPSPPSPTSSASSSPLISEDESPSSSPEQEQDQDQNQLLGLNGQPIPDCYESD